MMKKTHCNTEEAVDLLGYKKQSAHRSYSKQGHFLGVVPTKLPNGRLMWPIAELERLLSGGSK